MSSCLVGRVELLGDRGGVFRVLALVPGTLHLHLVFKKLYVE